MPLPVYPSFSHNNHNPFPFYPIITISILSIPSMATYTAVSWLRLVSRTYVIIIWCGRSAHEQLWHQQLFKFCLMKFSRTLSLYTEIYSSFDSTSVNAEMSAKILRENFIKKISCYQKLSLKFSFSISIRESFRFSHQFSFCAKIFVIFITFRKLFREEQTKFLKNYTITKVFVLTSLTKSECCRNRSKFR
jgi:hypothetical protein